MIRFAVSALLALSIHAAFLSTAGKWFDHRAPAKPAPEKIYLSLTYRIAEKPLVKTEVSTHAIPQKFRLHRLSVPASPAKPAADTAPALKKRLPQIQKKPQTTPKVAHRKLKPKTEAEPIPRKNPRTAFDPQTLGVTPKRTSTFQPAVPNDQYTMNIHEDDFRATTDQEVAEIPKPPIVREARPIYHQNPVPKYPRTARKRGYQGTVVLEVLVSQKGKVEDLRVFQSSGYSILDRAAITSVKAWQFEPGKRREQPVDMWVRIPVRFELKQNDF